MNKLTEKLLAEGYTKENHPDFVEWSNYKDFEYTHKYLLSTVWETPCGLLKKGINLYNHGSYMGVDYCPENDNPQYGCPYYDEVPCKHRDEEAGIRGLWGCNCIYHKTDKPYDYEQSTEKLWDEWNEVKHEAWLEAIRGYGYCVNMKWDRPSRRYIPKFIINNCISVDCQNEACAITKLQRNLERVNIFYDVLRERHYKKGLIEDIERSITKGVKKFEKPIARTDAEIWLKKNKDKFEPRYTRDDRTELHFSEHHGKTGYGEYDWCEFTVTPQNIRIEKRDSKDLLQDLQDAQEGIGVIHASDQAKAVKKAKSERLKKAKEKREKPENILKKIIRLCGQESTDKARELLSATNLNYGDISEETGISARFIEKLDEITLEIPTSEKVEQLSLF